MLPSLGFTSKVFIASDKNQIPTSLILLHNDEMYQLIKLWLKKKKKNVFRQGWVQGFEYMSPMLRLLSIFWLLSEHWFHSSADFLYEASCSLQAIFLTAHVLNQYMILSPLASLYKIREISALFASHSHP